MKSVIVKTLGAGLFGLIAMSVTSESSGAGLFNLLEKQGSSTKEASRVTPVVQEVSSDGDDEELISSTPQQNVELTQSNSTPPQSVETTQNKERREPSSNARSLMDFGEPYFPKASSNNEISQVNNKRESGNKNQAIVPTKGSVRRQGANNEATAYDNFARESIMNGLPSDVLSKLRASKSGNKKALSGNIDIWGADKSPVDLRQLEDIQGKQKFYISIMGQVFPLYTGTRIENIEQIDSARIAVAGYELNEDTIGNQLIKDELKSFYGEAEELRKGEIAVMTEQSLQAREARLAERNVLLQSEILRKHGELEMQAQINRDRAKAELDNIKKQIAEETSKCKQINAELNKVLEQVRGVSEELVRVRGNQEKLLVALDQQKQVLNQNYSELQKSVAKNHQLKHEMDQITEEAKRVEAKLQEFARANEEGTNQLENEKVKTAQLVRELQLSGRKHEELQKSLAEERSKQSSLRQNINRGNSASEFDMLNTNATSFLPNNSGNLYGTEPFFSLNSSNKF